MNEEIVARIRVYPEEGLPCPVAHYIAAELSVMPIEVGRTADEMGVRGTMCQLGLFGYALKGKPAYRMLSEKFYPPPMEAELEDLEKAIREAVVDGRVSCASLWKIAKRFDLSRLEVGNAADALNIKVKPCQLGFF